MTIYCSPLLPKIDALSPSFMLPHSSPDLDFGLLATVLLTRTVRVVIRLDTPPLSTLRYRAGATLTLTLTLTLTSLDSTLQSQRCEKVSSNEVESSIGKTELGGGQGSCMLSQTSVWAKSRSSA